MTPWTIDIIEVGVIPDLPLNLYIQHATPEQRLDVPCYSYLLTNGASCLLIDTGPDRMTAGHSGLCIVGDARAALLAALSRRKLAPADIDLVIHTHLHYDHIQNDQMFSSAQILVQEDELAWGRSPNADRFYVGIEAWYDGLADRVTPIKGESQPHKGVLVLPNGGHTPGHQSVLVDVEGRTVCLCADIVPMTANVQAPPPVCYDLASTEAFLIKARQESWEMIPGHDPVLRSHAWYVTPSQMN